jgi:ribosomal protein L37E
MYTKLRTIQCLKCGQSFTGHYNLKKKFCNVCYYQRRYMHSRPDLVDITKKILNYQEEYKYSSRVNDPYYNMLVKEADSRLKGMI